MTSKSNGEAREPSSGAQALFVDKFVDRTFRGRRTTPNIAVDEFARCVGATPIELEAFGSRRAPHGLGRGADGTPLVALGQECRVPGHRDRCWEGPARTQFTFARGN
jgi:hypothetical protein